MATDFFDDDLTAHSAPRNLDTSRDDEESYHDRRKRELPEQLSQTSDEMERLRLRQEALEKRKQEIADQRRRIELFERNRRDLLEKLRRNAVMVVRDGERASRTAALCAEASTLFSKLHHELEGIAPERWSEEDYDAKLTETLAKVDSATAEYKKAMDRVAAVGWSETRDHESEDEDPRRPPAVNARIFLRYLVAGVAFSIPLVILLMIAAVALVTYFSSR